MSAGTPERVTRHDGADRRTRQPTAGDWAGQRRYDRARADLQAAAARVAALKAEIEAERAAWPRLIRRGLDAGLSLRQVGGLLGTSYETVRRWRSRP